MPAVAGFPVADVASKLLVCKARSLHVFEKPVLDATIVENIDGKYPVAGKLPDDLAAAVKLWPWIVRRNEVLVRIFWQRAVDVAFERRVQLRLGLSDFDGLFAVGDRAVLVPGQPAVSVALEGKAHVEPVETHVLLQVFDMR